MHIVHSAQRTKCTEDIVHRGQNAQLSQWKEDKMQRGYTAERTKCREGALYSGLRAQQTRCIENTVQRLHPHIVLSAQDAGDTKDFCTTFHLLKMGYFYLQ